jgi:hypothetical protein
LSSGLTMQRRSASSRSRWFLKSLGSDSTCAGVRASSIATTERHMTVRDSGTGAGKST